MLMSKQQQQTQTNTFKSSSSSRIPLSNISNKMSVINTSGGVKLMRGDANKPQQVVSPKAAAAAAAITTTPKRTPLQRLNQRSENSFKKPPPSKKLKLRDSWSRFRQYVNSEMPKEKSSRPSPPVPFPTLQFAEKGDLWNVMTKKESGMYLRDPQILAGEKHSNLQPRMRAILVDWLIEVSEVYKLHRETLYLGVDFLDRYLSSTCDMPRSRLQLVGITCLFVAAKIEEIYPPKLREFAFVTDGACSEEEITTMELVVLKGLNWGLSPQTPNRWLKTYMQVNSLTTAATATSKDPEEDEKFVTRQFSEHDFLRAMQLMDLVILDVESLGHKYSVLAASVIYHCQDEQSALDASGYRWEDIKACVEWMSPYASALRESEAPPPSPRSFSEVQPEDYHNIQTHTVELTVLELAQSKAQLQREEQLWREEAFSVYQETAGLLMTPPTPANRHSSTTSSSTYDSEGKVDKRKDMGQQSSVFLSPTSEAETSGVW